MIDWQRFKETVDLGLFKRIFRDCLDVGNEKVMIIGDYGSQNRVIAPILTNAYALAARELGLDYSVVMQHSKTRGDFADEVMIAALKRLPKRSLIIMNVSNRIGHLGSLGLSFRNYCYDYKHKFVTSSSLGTLSNDSLKQVLRIMNVDYKQMDTVGQRIKTLLDKGSEVQIRTKGGTDLTIGIKGMNAIVNSGTFNKFGLGGNLPAGEVYISPNLNEVEGTFVIDGSLRLKDKTLLVRNPVKVEVRKGSIVNISNNYEGKLFKDTLEWAHRRSKKPEAIRRIAELGIGINPNANIVGATIIDEKTKGTVHIANGSNYWFGGTLKSIIHLDHVLRDARVRIDGKLLRGIS